MKLVSMYDETMSSEKSRGRAMTGVSSPNGSSSPPAPRSPSTATPARRCAAWPARPTSTLLVNYYFKTKTGLLEAALVPPSGWTESIAAVAASPARQRGAALVRLFVDAWDDPATAEFLRSAILTAAHEPVALERLTANLGRYILDAISDQLDGRERFVRASLVSSQMVGLAMTRYIWRAGAIAQLSSDEVVASVGPTIQRYLTGKLAS